ncbi:hypothetical protein Goshw_008965 [Gossypium schwendimanii]|uniref:DUF7745 domain-containing protein n=1 Tax=Gossypium schwendimanii TaxID=34291 RepID=A0A7J9LF69_GOSSC|nr:hypothetical protein [Gossypium schwendimanii]
MCLREYGNPGTRLRKRTSKTSMVMVHFWDPTYRCFMFNEMDMSNIRDAMGKANGDRHLSLFAFAIYGLIVFPKALGYVSVELADFLFHIEKVVNLTPEVLAETIISLNFIRRKGDRRFLGCTQLLFIWMKSHFRCLYKHFRQVFIPLTRPIKEFLESEWPPNQSIEEWVQNLSALTCQEIERRVPWMIRSTVLIGCGGHL